LRLRIAGVDCGVWPRLGPIGRKPQVPEDAFHHARVLDHREQSQPAATARTVEHTRRPARPTIAIRLS
jgi:hypothetical protein